MQSWLMKLWLKNHNKPEERPDLSICQPEDAFHVTKEDDHPSRDDITKMCSDGFFTEHEYQYVSIQSYSEIPVSKHKPKNTSNDDHTRMVTESPVAASGLNRTDDYEALLDVRVDVKTKTQPLSAQRSLRPAVKDTNVPCKTKLSGGYATNKSRSSRPLPQIPPTSDIKRPPVQIPGNPRTTGAVKDETKYGENPIASLKTEDEDPYVTIKVNDTGDFINKEVTAPLPPPRPKRKALKEKKLQCGPKQEGDHAMNESRYPKPLPRSIWFDVRGTKYPIPSKRNTGKKGTKADETLSKPNDMEDEDLYVTIKVKDTNDLTNKEVTARRPPRPPPRPEFKALKEKNMQCKPKPLPRSIWFL